MNYRGLKIRSVAETEHPRTKMQLISPRCIRLGMRAPSRCAIASRDRDFDSFHRASLAISHAPRDSKSVLGRFGCLAQRDRAVELDIDDSELAVVYPQQRVLVGPSQFRRPVVENLMGIGAVGLDEPHFVSTGVFFCRASR